MNVEEKKSKKISRKSHSVLEGFKGGPFEHTKSFSAKCFLKNLSNIYEKFICYQFKICFHKNMHVIKKKEIFDHKVFKLQRFSKVSPNVCGNALFWRGH